MTASNTLARQARLGADHQRFGIERRIAHRQEIVEQLHRVAGADRAGLDDAAGERLEQRPRARDRRRVAADHDVERSLPGVLRRAAERRVDEARSAWPPAPRRAAGSKRDRRSSNRRSAAACPPRRARSSPWITASTCGEPVTHSTTTSLVGGERRAATSPPFAPRRFRSSTASRRRWPSTVSGQPFSTMFLAMPWPIMPTPTKPIRSFIADPSVLCPSLQDCACNARPCGWDCSDPQPYGIGRS